MKSDLAAHREALTNAEARLASEEDRLERLRNERETAVQESLADDPSADVASRGKVKAVDRAIRNAVEAIANLTDEIPRRQAIVSDLQRAHDVETAKGRIAELEPLRVEREARDEALREWFTEGILLMLGGTWATLEERFSALVADLRYVCAVDAEVAAELEAKIKDAQPFLDDERAAETLDDLFQGQRRKWHVRDLPEGADEVLAQIIERPSLIRSEGVGLPAGPTYIEPAPESERYVVYLVDKPDQHWDFNPAADVNLAAERKQRMERSAYNAWRAAENAPKPIEEFAPAEIDFAPVDVPEEYAARPLERL